MATRGMLSIDIGKNLLFAIILRKGQLDVLVEDLSEAAVAPCVFSVVLRLHQLQVTFGKNGNLRWQDLSPARHEDREKDGAISSTVVQYTAII